MQNGAGSEANRPSDNTTSPDGASRRQAREQNLTASILFALPLLRSGQGAGRPGQRLIYVAFNSALCAYQLNAEIKPAILRMLLRRPQAQQEATTQRALHLCIISFNMVGRGPNARNLFPMTLAPARENL